MMIAARHFSGARRARLPYDAEVGYLETANVQYIDVGLKANLDSHVEFSFVVTDDTRRYVMFFGSRRGWGNDAFCAWAGTNEKGAIQFGKQGSPNFSKNIPAGHPCVCTLSKGGSSLVMDGGIFMRHPAYNVPFETPRNCLLMKGYWAAPPSTDANGSFARYFYLKWWQSGVLVRDFIPVRFTNGQGRAEGAMFDRANPEGGPLGNGLYPNSGTGAFIIGPDL